MGGRRKRPQSETTSHDIHAKDGPLLCGRPDGRVRPGARHCAGQPPLDLPPRDTAPEEVCGTGRDRLRQLGLVQPAARADGEGLSFRQDPPLLLSDFTPARWRSAIFWSPATCRPFASSRGMRAVSRNVVANPHAAAGRTFGQRVRALMAGQRSRSCARCAAVGLGSVGTLLGGVARRRRGAGSGSNVWLRMAPTSLPRVEVRSIGAGTCSTGNHVVNIVLPGFGEGYVSDEYGFDLAQVTRSSISLSPTRTTASRSCPTTHIASYAAFIATCRTRVRGIGLNCVR